MKKFLLFLLFGTFYQNVFATSVLVTKIIDGDTFAGDILLSDGIVVKSIKVRLRNVDTPEIHGKCDSEILRAKDAKQKLSELIPVGTMVEIENVKNDKYPGRIDANVFNSNNQDIGLILIDENLGRPYSGGKRESWCY